jgi:hypothetical protein
LEPERNQLIIQNIDSIGWRLWIIRIIQLFKNYVRNVMVTVLDKKSQPKQETGCPAAGSAMGL